MNTYYGLIYESSLINLSCENEKCLLSNLVA